MKVVGDCVVGWLDGDNDRRDGRRVSRCRVAARSAKAVGEDKASNRVVENLSLQLSVWDGKCGVVEVTLGAAKRRALEKLANPTPRPWIALASCKD